MKIPKIKKVKTKANGHRFEVRYLESGRGSRHRAIRFETRELAQAYVMKLMDRERANQGLTYLDNTTFADEAKFWLETRGQSLSRSHIIKVEGILKDSLPELGKLKPDRFHHGFLTEVQAYQLREGLANQTVNHKIQVIKAILRHSYQCRRIPNNPSAGFKMLKANTQDIDFWDLQESEEFLAFANSKYPSGSPYRWVYVVYLMALNTGMRAGEIWGLKSPGDKPVGSVLKVDRQFDRSVQQMGPTKGKASRNVPCSEMLSKEIQVLLKEKDRPAGVRTLFYHSETLDPICHEVFVRRFFKRDLKESRVRKIRFHDLRHTAATLMIDRGVDLVTVSKILGHKEMKTTMIYLHLLPNKIADTAAIFSVGPRLLQTENLERPRLSVLR
jgi:integrase